MTITEQIKLDLENIMADLVKTGGDNHNKAASLRVRNGLAALKNNITQYKRELQALDKK
jgi:hypothetical protein